MSKKTLRLILGDQLNHKHSWWSDDSEDFTVLMVESKSETSYAEHHIQKVVAFFLAMRNFRDWLINRGFEVIYICLDDERNSGSITQNLADQLKDERFESWQYQLPDEYRLDQELKAFSDRQEKPFQSFDTQHFMSERADLQEFFKGSKTYLMESFYRMMRKKHNILMKGNDPAGNKWNYDQSNRKSLPKNHRVIDPKTFDFEVDKIVAMLKQQGVETMGRINPENFIWPVTRRQSLSMLSFFIEECLPDFGNYQDAMKTGEWSLYHSRLSFAMNSKMIDPMEVVKAAEDAWEKNPEKHSLSAVEGFIRQIIGWREYMRGVYWAKMPGYAQQNFFNHKRKLPSWYWTGDTKMKCLSQAINQSLDYAYAHHIQRLMITGNFALLIGADPDEVDAWYLGVYIDAIEWVEITNTRGMSQYADGGLVGTKPYVSTANYINKMSDYCDGCHYKKNKKIGDDACPFNSLYWDFYDRHREKLQDNTRIGFVYPTLDKMKGQKLEDLLKQADRVLGRLEEL